MPFYRVELVGEAREVYVVEAASAEEAREQWMSGSLLVSESSSMEIESVSTDQDEEND